MDTRGMTVWQASDKWFEETERLLKDLEITPGHVHEQFGLKKEDIPHIAKTYSNDFCSQGNPKALQLRRGGEAAGERVLVLNGKSGRDEVRKGICGQTKNRP